MDQPASTDRRDELDDFFDNATVGLHLVTGDGTIVRANRADFEPLGYAPEEYIGHHIAEFHADQATIEDILGRLGRGEALDRYRARLRAKDGSLRHVEISSSVNFRDGEFINTRCFTIDVTDQVETRQALDEAVQRLADTYENVLAGISEVDAEGRFLRVNRALTEISGFAAEELLQTSIFAITHPEDLDEDRSSFARQVAGEIDGYTITKRYVRKDGQIVWVEIASSSVRDEEGHFRFAVRHVQDVTARQEAEAQQKLLLDELNHRVKNTLATVQSLVVQTARNCQSVEEFRASFEPRLIALSKAHDRLTRNRWEGANLAEIVAEEFGLGAAPADRMVAAGPDVILPTRASLSLGMALHELTTNAAKYGALSVPGGKVDLRWNVDRQGPFPCRVRLDWVESGGPAVTQPEVEGFGSRLLRVTAKELDGDMTMEFAPEGFRWSLAFDLKRGANDGRSE
ncbi:MAG TPA: PAS domain S-box protein [Sphingomicrobium sp.]|nr:PAS domain S-box protein [Sphingomicrobium sp.]